MGTEWIYQLLVKQAKGSTVRYHGTDKTSSIGKRAKGEKVTKNMDVFGTYGVELGRLRKFSVS